MSWIVKVHKKQGKAKSSVDFINMTDFLSQLQTYSKYMYYNSKQINKVK